jgi:hypothetical protein
MLKLIPLQFSRRQLHKFNYQKGAKRPLYGGTRSLGFKRGSLVKHVTHGLSYIGGTSKGRVSLHDIETGKRICQNARVEDIKFLAYNSWRTVLLPALKDGVSAPEIG